MTITETKTCPFCAKPIAQTEVVCGSCADHFGSESLLFNHSRSGTVVSVEEKRSRAIHRAINVFLLSTAIVFIFAFVVSEYALYCKSPSDWTHGYSLNGNRPENSFDRMANPVLTASAKLCGVNIEPANPTPPGRRVDAAIKYAELWRRKGNTAAAIESLQLQYDSIDSRDEASRAKLGGLILEYKRDMGRR
jgi:hypothetical protein